jgi:holin-like protein
MTNYFSSLLWRRCRSSRLFQIFLILLFWAAGESIARLTHLMIPGPVLGLFIVLLLLLTKRLNILTVRRGAQWFLAEMLLFFIPAVLAVLDHPELLGLLGLKILAVILIGTATIMVVTAAAIDLCYRWVDRESDADVLG